MQIMHWLTRILRRLSFTGAYEHRIEALFGLEEPFAIFNNEDRYFRDRKTWAIYRPLFGKCLSIQLTGTQPTKAQNNLLSLYYCWSIC